MGEIFITIVVPVYKVEQYLKKCVDSIINQSYRHLEILLVDDGSPDNSGEICDEYARKDKRVRVIHKKNGGLSDARNTALEIATGDYVMFVDSDDWIDANACEKLAEIISEKNADIVVFGYYKIYESGKSKRATTDNPRLISSSEGIRFMITFEDKVGNFACNKIYSKSLFDGVRFPVGKLYEDQGTTYKLFHKAERIYLSDLPLYFYLQRSSSISADWYRMDAINTRIDFWEERLCFLKDNYPDLADAQTAQIIGDFLVGRVKLKSHPEYQKFEDRYKRFVADYKPDFRKLGIYNPKVKLYSRSRLLFNLFVKYLYKKN